MNVAGSGGSRCAYFSQVSLLVYKLIEVWVKTGEGDQENP
jgi:hypothetical protein